MLRVFLFVLAAAFVAGCSSTSDSPDAAGGEKKPGMLGRMMNSTKKLNPFGKKSDEEKAAAATKAFYKGLVLTMTVTPEVVNLGETREIEVMLKLENQSKKLVQLEFPTTQRIEVLVRNQAGAQVEQWSEDHAFRAEPGMVAINSRERLEYRAVISTRDFAAGQEYTVSGFFPNYEPLKAEKKIVPVR